MATASSGLTDLPGVFPNKSFTTSCTYNNNRLIITHKQTKCLSYQKIIELPCYQTHENYTLSHAMYLINDKRFLHFLTPTYSGITVIRSVCGPVEYFELS